MHEEQKMAASRNSTHNTTTWKNHIEQWKKSNLSQAAYCREHQLDESQLSYYKRKFADTLLPSKPQPQSGGFISVQVTPELQPVEPLTLHFANGAHLSGITAANVSVVKQLARALA
jgi:hypothetical protein